MEKVEGGRGGERKEIRGWEVINLPHDHFKTLTALVELRCALKAVMLWAVSVMLRECL